MEECKTQTHQAQDDNILAEDTQKCFVQEGLVNYRDVIHKVKFTSSHPHLPRQYWWGPRNLLSEDSLSFSSPTFT